MSFTPEEMLRLQEWLDNREFEIRCEAFKRPFERDAHGQWLHRTFPAPCPADGCWAERDADRRWGRLHLAVEKDEGEVFTWFHRFECPCDQKKTAMMQHVYRTGGEGQIDVLMPAPEEA
ncbi:MAG: hypothetical protein RL885_06665 [Planctomycetota bacterium]